MAEKDKVKWDNKYGEMPTLLEKRPPSKTVSAFYADAPGKRALDLACGGGRHTLFLSERGFSVDAVDISAVALEALRKKADAKKVTIIEADLDTYTPEKKRYDLIVNTNYLDRELIERTKNSLKPCGIFIVETYMEDDGNEKKNSNPDFLLKKGELIEIFSHEFDVLEYREFWNEPFEKYRMRKQAIAVQKK